jgi:hypothetical protein
MKSSNLERCAVALSAAAVLAGCGAPSLSPAGEEPMPQGAAAPAAVAENPSWILRGSLLYVVTPRRVDILSYPDGALEGRLKIPRRANGVCSDPKGRVFVTVSPSIVHGAVYAYEHAGTKPIAILHDKEGAPFHCAVDPTTGNLATLDSIGSGPGHVSIYLAAKGPPKRYSDPDFYNYYYCTYDNDGNLFVTGINYQNRSALAELPKGSSTFRNIRFKSSGSGFSLGPVHWDGSGLAVGQLELHSASALIYHVQVTGSKGSVVGTTKLAGEKIEFAWLYDGVAIGVEGPQRNEIGLWHFPAGGSAFKTLAAPGEPFEGAAISPGSR